MKICHTNLFLILFICVFPIIISAQSKSNIVLFEVYEMENQPLPGVNITVKNLNPIIGTQTDFDGKAELILIDMNVTIELSFLGPYLKFELFQKVDLVKVDFSNQKVTYYYQNKRVRRKRLKSFGF